MIGFIRQRLERLERILKPQDVWTVCAEYEDGTMRTMTAKEYRQEKKKDPLHTHIADIHISGNTKELTEYLHMVRDSAIYYEENGITESFII